MLKNQMMALLGEAEGKEMEVDVDAGLQQLALAMDSLGMDPQDEDAQEAFIHFLKQMAQNKATLKRVFSKYSATKAAKAVKAAKASL